jgi:long-chain acyl-CoA synthetase
MATPRSSAAVDYPWLAHYGDVPTTVDYPTMSVAEHVLATAQRTPHRTAFDFLGTPTTFGAFADATERWAAARQELGVAQGDRVVVALPTSPVGVASFYGTALAGAVPCMVHPLSTADEIATYLRLTGARVALTLDAFHGVFDRARRSASLDALVLTRITDGLPRWKRLAFRLTKGRKIPPVPRDADVLWWTSLLERAAPAARRQRAIEPDDAAVILFSGGTTGTPKAIVLSHRNLLSAGAEINAWFSVSEQDVVLAALPIFHGFGLGAQVHAPLSAGARLVLVPKFEPEELARLIRSKRPTLMAGVPTLYESLSRDPALQTADLSSLRAAVCGADTLPRSVKERFERLVAERGGTVSLVEGYGLSETVTGIMCQPLHEYREGSIGVPLPNMRATICAPGTNEELPPGEEGEICIAGPSVMLGYLGDDEATADALHVHPDGTTWLHTGDIGLRDEDGFFRFRARLKRMIKSSGFNVYPAEVEAVLREHPAVTDACVVGIPDERQGERVRAVVVPRDPAAASDELAEELRALCRERLIKWSCPRDVEFREELPLTKIGKVDFMTLIREAEARG